jgi:hypothetical protein
MRRDTFGFLTLRFGSSLLLIMILLLGLWTVWKWAMLPTSRTYRISPSSVSKWVVRDNVHVYTGFVHDAHEGSVGDWCPVRTSRNIVLENISKNGHFKYHGMGENLSIYAHSFIHFILIPNMKVACTCETSKTLPTFAQYIQTVDIKKHY